MRYAKGSCSVCQHPSVRSINRAILQGWAHARIEAEWFVGRMSITRHKARCLKLMNSAALVKQKVRMQVDVYDEFREQLEVMKGLRDAAMEYLQDPLDGRRISLGPRAEEIDVIFSRYGHDAGTGEVKKVRDRETLQELLERLEEQHPGIKIEGFQARRIDFRRYAIDLVNQTDKCIAQFAKLEGLYTKERDNSTSIGQGIKAFNFWRERNPQASGAEICDAMEYIARGINISAQELAKKLRDPIGSPSIFSSLRTSM